MASVQFWFEFASTYSYPAAMRLADRAAAANVALDWRPFLLGPIFHTQGWNDSPFNVYPVKGRYMWRDLERICRQEGLPLRPPTHFPRPSLIAARVACLAKAESWGPDFVRAVYHANFAEDREIGEAEVIGAILTDLGLDAETLMTHAQTAAVKSRLRANTDEAIALGIFGAPSFVVGRELFWGNDRLDDAIAWAAAGG